MALPSLERSPNKWELSWRAIGGKYLSNRGFYLACTLTSLALFLVPLIGWTGVFTHQMNLGGDNSLLYFPFPVQWMKHFALSGVSQNLSGYSPAPQYLFMSLWYFLINIMRLNSEGVYFGVVLAGSFLGTVLLTKEIINLTFQKEGGTLDGAAFAAGIVAVSTPLLAQTQWSAILPGLMCELLLPWLLLLFLRHQVRGGWSKVLAACLLCVLGAAAISDAPSSIGAAVGGAIILASLRLSRLWKPNWKRVIEFLVSIVTVQLFWIIPFVLSFKYGQGATTVSASGKSSALALLKVLAPYQSVRDALELRQSTPMMQASGWPQLLTGHWSDRLGLLGLLPWLVVIAALLLLLHFHTRHIRKILLSLTIGSILTFILFCPNVWGIDHHLSAILNDWIPGWVAERNFYATLGLPYVEVLAVTAGVALAYILSMDYLGYWKNGLIAFFAIALVIYNGPFFLGRYFWLPYSGTIRFTRVLQNGLPQSYYSLIERLNQLPPGGVLSLPLSAYAWSIISDGSALKTGSGIYIGISPVFALTGRPDYNSPAAFVNPLDPLLPEKITDLLSNGEVAQFANFIREIGVRYMIVNTVDMESQNYLGIGATSSPVLEDNETIQLARLFAPHVIASSGTYQLREFANSDSSFPISLLDSTSVNAASSLLPKLALGVQSQPPINCNYWLSSVDMHGSTSVTINLRRANVSATQEGCTVVLMNLYSQRWKASLKVNGSTQVLQASSQPALGYLTGFTLPNIDAKSATIKITFAGQNTIWLSLGASLGGILLLVVLAITDSYSNRVHLFRPHGTGSTI